MEKLKAFFKKLTDAGVPLVFFRDYQSGKPSITFTMTIISFLLCVGAVISKVSNSKLFGDIDYSECSNLLIISLGAYIGRKFQNNGKEITLEKE